MSEGIELIYTKKGFAPIRMVITDHPWEKVCTHIESRMFPGSDVKAKK